MTRRAARTSRRGADGAPESGWGQPVTVVRVPRLTVVIPVFNGEVTIPEALESVRRQSWTDWQVLVSDDRSEDGTVALVRALDDPRIRVLETQQNTGPGPARNRALAQVDTELVAF